MCVCVERSDGISIGCEEGKGSCLWPDLAQREGVSPILSSAFIWLAVISLSQAVVVKSLVKPQLITPTFYEHANACMHLKLQQT